MPTHMVENIDPLTVLISSLKIWAHSPNKPKKPKFNKNFNPYPISWIQRYSQKTISRYCPVKLPQADSQKRRDECL